MLEQDTVQRQTVWQVGTPAATAVRGDDAIRLIESLQGVGMLKSSFRLPAEWIGSSELPTSVVVGAIQGHISKAGFHRILEMTRYHNRHHPEASWNLSRADDFLAAAELALEREGTRAQEGTGVDGLEGLVGGSSEARTSGLVQGLKSQMRLVIDALMKPASTRGRLLSPRALWTQLRARAKRARAEAQVEHTLGKAALHVASAVGTDVERTIAMTRLDGLRTQLGDQLEVFCEERGLPLPKPYSREEAYCLHLLTADFVSIAGTEEAIAKRASSMAHRQVALEGERAEALLDSRTLPESLDALCGINPLREGFLRERVRHKSALMVNGLIGVVLGSLWGVVESASDVLIAGISRYAPVVALPLLVGLGTLAAQTVVRGVPLASGAVAEYFGRALWNSTLTLGAAMVAYGCWQYFTTLERKHVASPRGSAVSEKGQRRGIKASNNVA